MNQNKTINVVAAVIVDKEKILATRRGYGDFAGKWEFPGGKIETGEKPEAALIREIKEELDVNISVGKLIDLVEYDYPKFHLSMKCYLCEIISGEVKLIEHNDAKWLKIEELYSVEWIPADILVVEKLKNYSGGTK